METQVEVRKAVWSRYWSHGVAHSCGGSYGNRYDGALAHFWRSHFDSMSPGARMLDIATGNGAVPQLMLDSAPATVACDAIDLALPEPAWLADLAPNRRRQVRFHGQQAAESLPFADASFDLVTSQYGLEYTDLARSVPEVLRVLRPGGKVCLLTHHADARPVQLARSELGHLAWLQGPSGLLETGFGMIEPMARARTEAGRASLDRRCGSERVARPLQCPANGSHAPGGGQRLSRCAGRGAHGAGGCAEPGERAGRHSCRDGFCGTGAAAGRFARAPAGAVRFRAGRNGRAPARDHAGQRGVAILAPGGRQCGADGVGHRNQPALLIGHRKRGGRLVVRCAAMGIHTLIVSSRNCQAQGPLLPRSGSRYRSAPHRKSAAVHPIALHACHYMRSTFRNQSRFRRLATKLCAVHNRVYSYLLKCMPCCFFCRRR
ncbi:class I SAM-dependent methyltransferase [Massilia sp. Se16.2.3]|nr:class I SAM-dependent methyltransferase [Massilia sp. Se16.2.3]